MITIFGGSIMLILLKNIIILIKKLYLYFIILKIKINNKNYWYGGWMSCEAKPSFFEIINFLKFQIKVSLLKKRLPWFAIIKKNNKFVYLINRKLKFNAIEDQKVITDIKKKFNISKKNQYHFLTK